MVWQWNHVPDDTKWLLSERPGYLRLHSLPAPDFWWARNSLTQRAIGPESTATTELDGSGLRSGDVAGLALLNSPYAWLGLVRNDNGYAIAEYDYITGKTVDEAVPNPHLWLRVQCNFDTEIAKFSYSADGKAYKPLGPDFVMAFQLTTFQGVRYALFNYNTGGAPGGQADFNFFTVDEPRPRRRRGAALRANRMAAPHPPNKKKEENSFSSGGEGKTGEVTVKSVKPGD